MKRLTSKKANKKLSSRNIERLESTIIKKVVENNLKKQNQNLSQKKISDKIEQIKKLRREIKDDYIRSTTRRNVIPKWKDVIQLLLPIDIKLLLVGIKVLGDMYIEFDDYETARNLFSFYKIVSFRLELLEETMYSYEALGNVYKFLYQYQKAILCYKKMIEMAWILGNRPVELRGYDHIGIQYFYLGNKEKAKYYHERMIYGLYEKDTKIKENVIENFRNKHYDLFNDDKVLIKNNYSNDELKEQFIRHILLYETARNIDLETYDILKNQEIMKNSFISDVNMTFQIIYEKYLSKDYLHDPNEVKKKHNYEKLLKKRNGFYDNKTEKDNLGHIDNLILSHLSTKRKDYSNERFEKIFQRFDSMFSEFEQKFNEGK